MMQAVRIQTSLEKDGELLLRNLPYKKNQTVEVIVLADAPMEPAPTHEIKASDKEDATILQKLASLADRMDQNLPPDLAENHDHYIHGTPKK